MKLKTIFPFVAAILLPFGFVSCGDKEEPAAEEAATEAAPAEPAPAEPAPAEPAPAPAAPAPAETSQASSGGHSGLGKQLYKVMTSIMDGMGSITDVKSAEDFVKTMEGANTSLKELLAAAVALDTPTDEEKEAMKAIKEEYEANRQKIGQKMFQMMAGNPDAEAIGAVLMQALNNPEMKEMSDKLDSIYAIEDEGSDLEAIEEVE